MNFGKKNIKMPKPNPHELYGDLTKKEEADLREYFSYAPCYELERGIAGVKKFFSNEEIDDEELLV